MTMALQTIRIEHFNLACVLKCLGRLVEGLGAPTREQDQDLLFLILDYIEAFPATFHHPKEEAYLFEALGRRRPETASLLDQLRDEHAKSLVLLTAFRAALQAWRDDPAALARVRNAGRRYQAFEEEHMLREEREILPLALEALTESDSLAIDAAFARNDDPLFGTPRAQQFDELFRLILTKTADATEAGGETTREPELSG